MVGPPRRRSPRAFSPCLRQIADRLRPPGRGGRPSARAARRPRQRPAPPAARGAGALAHRQAGGGGHGGRTAASALSRRRQRRRAAAGGIYKRRWDRDATQTDPRQGPRALSQSSGRRGEEDQRLSRRERRRDGALSGAMRRGAAGDRGRGRRGDGQARRGRWRRRTLRPGRRARRIFTTASAAPRRCSFPAHGRGRGRHAAAFATYPGSPGGIPRAPGRRPAALPRQRAGRDFAHEANAFAVGVTGHRPHKLNAARLEIIAADIRRALMHIEARLAPPARPRLLDRRRGGHHGRQAALALGWRLIAADPFPPGTMPATSRRPRRRRFPPPDVGVKCRSARPTGWRLPTRLGYTAASLAMLESADALIVVWDGAPTELKAGGLRHDDAGAGAECRSCGLTPTATRRRSPSRRTMAALGRASA